MSPPASTISILKTGIAKKGSYLSNPKVDDAIFFLGVNMFIPSLLLQ